MRKYSKPLGYVLTAILITSNASCATLSSWLVTNGPTIVEKTNAILAAVEIFKSTATSTFALIKGKLPVAEKDKAEMHFQKAMLALSVAQSTLADLLDVAATYQEDKASWQDAFGAVANAVSHIEYIVELYQNVAPAETKVLTDEALDLSTQAAMLKAKLLWPEG